MNNGKPTAAPAVFPYPHRTMGQVWRDEQIAAAQLDEWGRERRYLRPQHDERGASRGDNAKREQRNHNGRG